MTAKLDGTNGLIQSYDYQTPTTGFSYTFTPSSTGTVLVMNPAGTLATGTITMPASPVDGMTITVSSSQQITALTMAGNGASINNAVTLLPAKTAVTYVYRATGTTWWPVQSVPGTGSQLVSGTSQASTSGTSIDFTGIPSWVKRITVMFNNVSTSGTSPVQIQLGTGAGPTYTTTGYLSYIQYNGSITTSTTGLATMGVAAADARFGQMIISNHNGNVWVESCGYAVSGNGGSGGGGISLAAALTAIRVTTVGGTDTFDLGSINILYE